MSIHARPLAEIAPAEISALVGANPGQRRVATLAAWSVADAAIAAASLANAGGGLLLVGATADASGTVTGLPGASVTGADIKALTAALGPDGAHLIRCRAIDVSGKSVAAIAVDESGAPPVLVETDGTIYTRDDSGCVRVRTRAALDALLGRDRSLRDRAEHTIDGMIGRIAAGHFNYMSVAFVAVPRIASAEPYNWAAKNGAALVADNLGFSRRWDIAASRVAAAPAAVEVELASDVGGYIHISKTGCIAVGYRAYRPPREELAGVADFSAQLAEMVAVAAQPLLGTRSGKIVSALFLEGVRGLRLSVPGGLSGAADKDIVQAYLPERYVDSAESCGDWVRDLQSVAGHIFGADVVNGTGTPYAGAVPSAVPTPKTWHGITRRTERRISGLRAHGSGS